MSQKKKVRIAEAKGRPMLSWVGKRALTHVPAFPGQHIESFDAAGGAGPEHNDGDWSDWPDRYPRGGLLFHGDNKEVLAHLLASGFRGRVKLIYIDPPFDSGADYVRRVQLRGAKGTAKIEGEMYSLGEQIQYTDIWANDNYLQFMYERLLLLRELLAEDGSIWLHCDASRGHYLKLILDEVFGPDHFVNQVVWKRSDAHGNVGQGAEHLGAVHDMLLVYRKGQSSTWNQIFRPLPKSTADRWYRNVEEESGRRFNKADVTGPGGAKKGNPVYEWNGVRRAWRYSKESMQRLHDEGRLVYSSSGMPYQKRYLDESRGVPLQDWWADISMIRGIQRRATSQYPTEKPEELLKRILLISSNPGDLVLDCFIGSGTTAAVAQKLGRRWIGCDINKGAVQTASKRLQGVLQEQTQPLAGPPQGELAVEDGEEAEPGPAQSSFGVWRVNDYDLQIQHNEAVELACEHIGVERTRADGFFDGVLGKSLVKIVPFTHPLSPVDLDEVRRELEARPEEDRNIVMVCLGKETAADAWIDDWNALRKGKTSVNRIEVIELRTDPKYGKFIKHRPAEATVRVERLDGKVRVAVEDFVSPTIIERLEMDAPLFRAKIPDWRAMVDCVMIDPDFDGDVFRVALSDVPARKEDLVSGTYEIEAPAGGAGVVAVKIIDMLGEEVLVVDRP